MSKRKKGRSIGTSVLKKSQALLPKEVELTLKPLSPSDPISLKLKWEREQQRKISEEEFKRLLKEHLKKSQRKNRKRKPRMPKQLPYV